MNSLVIHNAARTVGLIAMVLMFNGCGHKPVTPEDRLPLPTRTSGLQDKELKDLEGRLTRQGVKLITIGQDYLVSVPADRVFADQSPRILWGSYPLLNDVVCYLKAYRLVGVNVTAYSSKYVSSSRERALTSARARAVGDYFSSQDIDSRFIFTRGLGSDKPIVMREQGGDNSVNSRIEITFRNEVV